MELSLFKSKYACKKTVLSISIYHSCRANRKLETVPLNPSFGKIWAKSPMGNIHSWLNIGLSAGMPQTWIPASQLGVQPHEVSWFSEDQSGVFSIPSHVMLRGPIRLGQVFITWWFGWLDPGTGKSLVQTAVEKPFVRFQYWARPIRQDVFLLFCYFALESRRTVLEFLNNLWGPGTE